MTTRADAHRPEFHREDAWKQPVRVATTANITISTALNNGDTIDGVTLATGDRVLVKDQSTGSQNGIYDVGASPVRSFDMDTGLEAWGCIVFIAVGTANGGKLYKNTNATVPLIGSTALTFAAVSSGADLSGIDYLVGTATGLLSAEIVVGTTPGGELGGTWPSPTVDTTHSGSSHAGVIATHEADTSGAHVAVGVSISDAGGYFTATDVEGALQEIGAGGTGTHYEVLMAAGSADPLETGDGLDWLYVLVPN